MIEKLFGAIDSKDSEGFGAFLTEGCLFRFGSQSSVRGQENVVRYVAEFFCSIQGVRHELADVWSVGEGVICHGHVTYVRLNGTQLRVPFSNIMKLDGSKVCEYLIFSDVSALYEG